MTPKEVMEKTYECFASGDMDAFTKLHTPDCVFIMNGAHQLSGTYNGMADFMERMMSKIPTVFPLNFSLEQEFMVAEGNTVFTHAKATGDGLDAYFGFCAEIEGDAIKKITIYADSQKLSNAFQSP